MHDEEADRPIDHRRNFACSMRRCLKDYRQLAPEVETLWSRYEKLGLQTYDHAATEDRMRVWTFPSIARKRFFLTMWHDEIATVPDDLQQKWREWRADFKAAFSANLRLQLMDLIADVSEREGWLSWPESWDDLIFEWVENDEFRPSPFSVGIQHRKVYDRLRKIRNKIGGWICLNNDDTVIFLPEEKWQVELDRRRKQWKTPVN